MGKCSHTWYLCTEQIYVQLYSENFHHYPPFSQIQTSTTKEEKLLIKFLFLSFTEPSWQCKWQNCTEHYPSASLLHQHLIDLHTSSTTKYVILKKTCSKFNFVAIFDFDTRYSIAWPRMSYCLVSRLQNLHADLLNVW